MFKLYYAPGACSLSPHIALRESGLPFEIIKVDFANNRATADGKTLAAVNPKNQVPALVLENGELLTEGAAMVQHIADAAPEAGLAPRAGTFERVRLQEWLNFIATELHKGPGLLNSQLASDELKAFIRGRVAAKYAYAAGSLTGQYLMGDWFTVADGYLFYTLRYWQRLTQSLPEGFADYLARVAARPAVAASLEAEGLK